METRDLPQVLHIEHQNPAQRYTRQHFLLDFQSSDIASWVATQGPQVLGYVICRVTPIFERLGTNRVDPPHEAVTGTVREPIHQTLRLTLLHLAVGRDCRRQGIGRTLLGRLERELRQPDDCLQAAVPETNLPVQLFLRSLGWRALGVYRGHYGSEDAYLMERRIVAA
jgi:ribosomal protein S18 acetylase RimI-like enzyme